jgi:F-type H+-transporting ATPase subunit b
MEIFNQFGIQPVLLLAQVVNFLILLFILKKFLYSPVLKMLEERKAKIAQSLKDAEEIEKKLAKTEEDRQKELSKALEEAKQIINEAKESATQVIAEGHEKANKDIVDLVEKARESMTQEREKMHQEIRQELSDMIVASLKAVTGKVLTKKDQEEIVEKNIKNL